MRQRGERGYRDDRSQRESRERGRDYGGYRQGSGGEDWERRGAPSQAGRYDEDYDEAENDWNEDYARGSRYGRQGFGPEEYPPERGAYTRDLDEGRFQTGQRRYSDHSSGSYDESRRYGQAGLSYSPYTGYSRQRAYGRGGMEQGRVGERGYYQQDWRRQGSHAGKAPQGYQRSDERIRDDVCDCLTDHPEIDPSNIDVKVESRTVTLTGTVDSRAAKRLAEDIAEGVTGVQDVRNELRVRRDGDQTPATIGAAHRK